jgi:hypothetical protein
VKSAPYGNSFPSRNLVGDELLKAPTEVSLDQRYLLFPIRVDADSPRSRLGLDGKTIRPFTAKLGLVADWGAAQHGPDGIRVNAAAPGFVYTPMVYGQG